MPFTAIAAQVIITGIDAGTTANSSLFQQSLYQATNQESNRNSVSPFRYGRGLNLSKTNTRRGCCRWKKPNCSVDHRPNPPAQITML